MDKSTKEQFAKFLYGIHGSFLIPPFYEGDGIGEYSDGTKEDRGWDSLSLEESDPENVYKIFFYNMTEYFISNTDIQKLISSNNKLDSNDPQVVKIAQLFSKIHAKSLSPFYMLEDDFWSELKEETDIDGDVDRRFFKELAVHIIRELRKAYK